LPSPDLGAKPRVHGLVAQLDRVLDYESRGRGFESSPVRHHPLKINALVHPYRAGHYMGTKTRRAASDAFAPSNTALVEDGAAA
jgi:hypothetical protein